MKITKHFKCTLLAALIVGSLPMQVLAKTTHIQEQKTFTDFDHSAIYPFAELIEKDKNQYRLIDTAYEVVETKPTIISDEIAVDLKSNPVELGKPYKPEETIEQDGTNLQLMSSVPEEIIVKSDITVPYSTIITYDNVPDHGIPATRSVDAVIAGETRTVTLPLKEILVGESKWIDKKINIIYNNYNSEYYVFNGVTIPHQTDKPALSGYETLIIQSVGLDPDNYRIHEIVWTGDPYYSNGILCRNAAANGKVLVNGKLAVYEDENLQISQDKKMQVFTNHYEGTKEIDTGKTEYIIEATATYELIPKKLNPAGPTVIIISFLTAFIFFFMKRKNVEVYAVDSGIYEYLGKIAVTKKHGFYVMNASPLERKAASNHYMFKLPSGYANKRKGSTFQLRFSGNDAKNKKIDVVLKEPRIFIMN